MGLKLGAGLSFFGMACPLYLDQRWGSRVAIMCKLSLLNIADGGPLAHCVGLLKKEGFREAVVDARALPDEPI